jgi:sulfatase maturation enzyme AslB (radical SAM superfamily)
MTDSPVVQMRRVKPSFSFYNFAQIGFFLFGIPANSFGSVDVTDSCNLRCNHCYFFKQDQAEQLTDKQWEEHFEKMKISDFNLFQCTWVGGEPLLRPSVIEFGKKYFKYNTITTNGTIPLPDWKDVSWYISVDGSKENHDKMRNTPGLHELIKQNIANSSGQKITIAFCITSQNHADISVALDEWYLNPKVQHIVFSFFTPIKGLDDNLWLGGEAKDKTLDLLIQHKTTFGDFIVNTKRSLSFMKSDKCRSVTDNCPFAEKSFAFAANGKQKKPCMLGEKADCTRCGCVVPFYLRSLTDKKNILMDLTSGLLNKLRFKGPSNTFIPLQTSQKD